MASIFIVEDEISLQELYKILSSAGFNIIGIASNGEEAVSMFEKFNKRPDVIIMDHRMPIMSGMQAAEEILKRDEKAKIIFASGDEGIKKYAKSIGALSFKVKPFSNEKLIRNIYKALGLANPQISL